MNDYYKITKTDSITIITLLFSELSIDEAERFKDALYSIISESRNRFIINMNKCVFMPSVVLGILVKFNMKVAEKKGVMVFCCLTEQVKTLFKITRLDKAFKVYATEMEAIAALQQR